MLLLPWTFFGVKYKEVHWHSGKFWGATPGKAWPKRGRLRPQGTVRKDRAWTRGLRRPWQPCLEQSGYWGADSMRTLTGQGEPAGESQRGEAVLRLYCSCPEQPLLTLGKGDLWFYPLLCTQDPTVQLEHLRQATQRQGVPGRGHPRGRSMECPWLIRDAQGSSSLCLQRPDTHLTPGLAHGTILCHMTHRLTHKSHTKQEQH